MADLLATKNNQLIRVPSKESLLSISTTVSEKSGQSQNQLIENDPLDVSESTTVTTSLTFEKLEVKDSSAVNIEDKFNCLSVNESAPNKKKKSIIICFLIISVICIGIAAYVAYYLYMTKPIRPVKNYTLHPNSYLQKHGLKKENFEGPIKEIYLDDFLDYSTDKDCANHNQRVSLNYHVCPNAEIYEDFGFNILPYNYVTDQDLWPVLGTEKFTNFFRIGIISKCGLKGITEEQVNMTHKFIEAHIVAQKIDLVYKLMIDTIKKEDSCHNEDGFKTFMNTFKDHIVTNEEVSGKLLSMQTSKLKSYLDEKEKDLILTKIHYPELIYVIMAMSRIMEYFTYFNDSLRNMNTNSSKKTSILSLNEHSFQNITIFLDNINLTSESDILKNKVDIMANDFKINFHSETRGTFNEEIFNFYKTFILPIYSLETMFSNTYDNIEEILNADDRTPHKNKTFVRNSKRVHESLKSLSETFAPYGSPNYSKSHINVLKNKFNEEVNYLKFSKVLYQVEYPNECPPNGIVFDDQCSGKLYECNLIPANTSCLCICDGSQDSETERFFYTGVIEVEQKGFVITGVRFAMKRDTIFLQIQVGRLLALGNTIDYHWQPLPIEYQKDRVEINYDRREMELVDLRLGVGFVLTGIQMFSRNETRISACIFGKSYNFFTGIIDYKNTSTELNWINNFQMIEVENTIPFIDPNADIQASIFDKPINYISLVKFGWSINGTEFLPYFDAQDVDVYADLYELSSALSGLELFYYYTEGYGGFIRPRVSTVNYYEEILDMMN